MIYASIFTVLNKNISLRFYLFMIQKNSAKVDTKVCARKKCLGTFLSKNPNDYLFPIMQESLTFLGAV